MIRLGLTGSIAMGKSTTAQMFAELGVPIHDADATVHDLYAAGGAGAARIAGLAPEAIGPAGVDRKKLRALISKRQELLTEIEALIHPLVAEKREEFFRKHADREVVLLDLPLLFETNSEDLVDYVVVVTADEATQRARALCRPGMTEEILQQILARQTPDQEKRKKADFVVDTSNGYEVARRQVAEILTKIRERDNQAGR